MADRTSIEWCHATVNAISGCTPCSPGCANCYAMRAGARRMPNHPSAGLTQETRAGHVWTGAVRFNDEWARKPLSWRRPRRIFWNAHGDPWHESVPVEWIDRELAIAALTPHHRHLFLTKRSARMRAYFADPAVRERILAACRDLGGLPARWTWPLPNVWLGVSVEDQQRADERIPDLLATPAALRWLSCEPILGPIHIDKGSSDWLFAWPYDHVPERQLKSKINWVVAGGESGPGARPMHPDLPVSLLDQCERAGIPFLFKQWGEFLPHIVGPEEPRSISVPPGHVEYRRVGTKAAGRRLNGVLHDGYPEIFPWEKQREAAHA